MKFKCDNFTSYGNVFQDEQINDMPLLGNWKFNEFCSVQESRQRDTISEIQDLKRQLHELRNENSALRQEVTQTRQEATKARQEVTEVKQLNKEMNRKMDLIINAVCPQAQVQMNNTVNSNLVVQQEVSVPAEDTTIAEVRFLCV